MAMNTLAYWLAVFALVTSLGWSEAAPLIVGNSTHFPQSVISRNVPAPNVFARKQTPGPLPPPATTTPFPTPASTAHSTTVPPSTTLATTATTTASITEHATTTTVPPTTTPAPTATTTASITEHSTTTTVPPTTTPAPTAAPSTAHASTHASVTTQREQVPSTAPIIATTVPQSSSTAAIANCSFEFIGRKNITHFCLNTPIMIPVSTACDSGIFVVVVEGDARKGKQAPIVLMDSVSGRSNVYFTKDLPQTIGKYTVLLCQGQDCASNASERLAEHIIEVETAGCWTIQGFFIVGLSLLGAGGLVIVCGVCAWRRYNRGTFHSQKSSFSARGGRRLAQFKDKVKGMAKSKHRSRPTREERMSLARNMDIGMDDGDFDSDIGVNAFGGEESASLDNSPMSAAISMQPDNRRASSRKPMTAKPPAQQKPGVGSSDGAESAKTAMSDGDLLLDIFGPSPAVGTQILAPQQRDGDAVSHGNALLPSAMEFAQGPTNPSNQEMFSLEAGEDVLFGTPVTAGAHQTREAKWHRDIHRDSDLAVHCRAKLLAFGGNDQFSDTECEIQVECVSQTLSNLQVRVAATKTFNIVLSEVTKQSLSPGETTTISAQIFNASSSIKGPRLRVNILAARQDGQQVNITTDSILVDSLLAQ